MVPGSDGYVAIRQDAAAPHGLGGQADGLSALPLPPYPQGAVLACADEI